MTYNQTSSPTYKPFTMHYMNLHIAREAFIVLLMQVAMPCQTIIVLLTQKYNSDFKLAAGNLFITSLISIITLPVVFWVIEYLYKMYM